MENSALKLINIRCNFGEKILYTAHLTAYQGERIGFIRSIRQ